MVRQRLAVPSPVVADTPLPPAYHHGRKVSRSIDQNTRQFIAWDGEGVNLDGNGRPQSYVLFGSSVGYISHREGLTTFECLDHIIETGIQHPTAIHCGFAFTYDANMIVQGLSPVTLNRLHKNGWVRIKRKNGDRYTVTLARGKYFRVTKYKPEYHPKTNPTAKVTVQIFDIFSFFMCSFIKAYEKNVGPVPRVITEGKAGRASFTIEEFDTILKYWTMEIQLVRELAEELRRRVFSAGLYIRQWYGPGALASFALTANQVKTHMKVSPDEVTLAARHGYAGGRFERFLIGRVTDPVWEIDINSAYPYAISQLPSMTQGTWRHVKSAEKLSRFGIYRIRMRRFPGYVKTPSPLFHRDRQHNISFPWHCEGWYWTPEAALAVQCGGEIVEGWEYRGAKSKPFNWIPDMYQQRKEWKEEGVPAELALKLCMNSAYGKLAQRVGWDPIRQRMPPFHQLEWAGWVTSMTRATLYGVMAKIPQDKLIAVETDGIYTTMPPDQLGITTSKELGGWEIKEYSEVMYVQSGFAWLKTPEGKWSAKRRGFDACRYGHDAERCDCRDVFSLDSCRQYLRELHPRPNRDAPWGPYKGQTTRFVGLGQALASRSFDSRHCLWETTPRDLIPGATGKRAHLSGECRACQAGATAYEMPHDTVIRSRAIIEPMCYPHSIPWAVEVGHAAWRDHDESGILPDYAYGA